MLKEYKKSKSAFERGIISRDASDKLTSQFCFPVIDHCGR